MASSTSSTVSSAACTPSETSDGDSQPPRGGVVEYPFWENMALTGIWSYRPDSSGPVITAEEGMLDISRGPECYAANQGTHLAIQEHFDVQSGLVIAFKLRYDSIEPASEVKLSLACGITLRYDGSRFNYCCWDPNTEWFHQLGPSSIQIGDGKFCKVLLCICPNAIHIFENGSRVGVRRRHDASPVQPTFKWQILAGDSELQAVLSDVLVVTTSFPPDDHSRWDVSFSSLPRPPSDDEWLVTRQSHDPFGVHFSPDGYMRISTRRLSIANSWLFTQAARPRLSDAGILMYRFRVNAAGGSSTKITLFGGCSLSLRGNGRHRRWGLNVDQGGGGGGEDEDGDSDIRVGSGAWTIVMLVYSAESVTLFEDGLARLSARGSVLSSPRAPLFHVQHGDAGTAVEVDLSHVRSVPMLASLRT